MNNIKLGATLFCFTKEYAEKTMNLEDCIKAAKECGSEGYEIVGTQMVPTYPNVTQEFKEYITSLNEKYDIKAITYSANNDRGKRADRDLSDEEMLADAIIDLKAAYDLGCENIRIQYMLSPEAFGRLAPYAELYDIKCGIEIHNPETPSTPKIKEYIKAIDEVGSKHLGLIPDFGSFATRPNVPHWNKALAIGVKEEHLQMAAHFRYDNVPIEEAREQLMEIGAHPAINATLQGMYGFVQFSNKPDLDGLAEIIPYVIEFHGKFHHIDENGHEGSIPYPDIFRVIQESNFSGYIMSEFENEDMSSGVMRLEQHLALEKKLLNK